MKKLLGIAYYNSDAHMGALFDGCMQLNSPQDIKQCSALLLHGGTDIGSSLYNELPHRTNQNRSGKPSVRDEFEVACIHHAVENKIPIFGICRGLQLLCAVDGGKLIQDLPHSFHGEAYMRTTQDDVLSCPVSHHQGVVLNPRSKNKVLAWELDSHLPYMVHFPKLNAFGVQGHPEWAPRDSYFVQYCLNFFKGMLK